MNSHPKKKKKKKKKKKQSKSEIKPRSRRWQRSRQSILYTKQKQIKPHYPTLQYRGVYQKKKKPNTEQKRNKIQSKKETPNPEQTKPTVAPPLLAGAARSVTSAAPRLVVVARLPPSSLVAGPSSLARRRRSERSHRLSCSAVVACPSPVGLKVFRPLFLSDSLSLTLK